MYRIAWLKAEELNVAYEADLAAVLTLVRAEIHSYDGSRLLDAIAMMKEGENVACGIGLVRVTRLCHSVK